MRARQPQRSTTADMTREPGSPIAAIMCGHAARVRSTRTLARRAVGPPRDPADDRAGDQQQRQRRRGRAVVGGGDEPPVPVSTTATA